YLSGVIDDVRFDTRVLLRHRYLLSLRWSSSKGVFFGRLVVHDVGIALVDLESDLLAGRDVQRVLVQNQVKQLAVALSVHAHGSVERCVRLVVLASTHAGDNTQEGGQGGDCSDDLVHVRAIPDLSESKDEGCSSRQDNTDRPLDSHVEVIA